MVEREAAAWTGAAADAAGARSRESPHRSSARSRAASTRASISAICSARRTRAGRSAARRRNAHRRARRVPPPRLLWGYVVAAILEELGDVHVVGLTATPPDELTEDEVELYDAAARAGRLHRARRPRSCASASSPLPGAGLADAPLTTERAWLAEHDVRFQRAHRRRFTTRPPKRCSLRGVGHHAHALARTRHRRERGRPLGGFQRRHPALARAGARFLASAGLDFRLGRRAARVTESNRPRRLARPARGLGARAASRADPAPPRHTLRGGGGRAARPRLHADAAGIRRGASDVDRLLTNSAAKPIALVEILAAEMEARAALRAVVLVDAERASAKGDPELAGVLDREAGTGTPPCAPSPPTCARRRCVRCSCPGAGCAAPGDAEAIARGRATA